MNRKEGDRGVDHVKRDQMPEGHDLNLMVLKWSPLRDPEDLKRLKQLRIQGHSKVSLATFPLLRSGNISLRSIILD